MAENRPNPLQWVYYVYGGRLPSRYKDWVLWDAAGAHWLRRHFLRLLAQVLPFFVTAVVVLSLLLPVSPWLIALGLAFATGFSVAITTGMAPELAEARLIRHGHPPGHGPSWRGR